MGAVDEDDDLAVVEDVVPFPPVEDAGAVDPAITQHVGRIDLRIEILLVTSERLTELPLSSGSLKRFLRRNPRLRELHSLAHLGAAFARHMAAKAAGKETLATAESFKAHFALPQRPPQK